MTKGRMNSTKVSIARLETKIDYISQTIDELKDSQKEIMESISKITANVNQTDRKLASESQRLTDHINQHKTDMVKFGFYVTVIATIVSFIITSLKIIIGG